MKMKGKKFRFEAKIDWRVLTQSAPFPNWRRGLDDVRTYLMWQTVLNPSGSFMYEPEPYIFEF